MFANIKKNYKLNSDGAVTESVMKIKSVPEMIGDVNLDNVSLKDLKEGTSVCLKRKKKIFHFLTFIIF